MISVTVVSLVVGLAVLGFLGVRTTTRTETANGYSLSVAYALISRAGLATPLSIVVGSVDGTLPSSVTVKIATDYLGMLDEHGLIPEPVQVSADDRWTWWTFELPTESSELQIDFDARLEPGAQWRRESSLALWIDDAAKVETVITTWIAP